MAGFVTSAKVPDGIPAEYVSFLPKPMPSEIANHVAAQGIGVLYFQQDMTEDEMVTKLVANRAEVDSKRIEMDLLTAEEDEQIASVTPAIAKLPIWWECAAQFSIDAMVLRYERLFESITGS